MLKKMILSIVNLVSVLVIAMAVVMLLTVILTGSGDVPDICGYSFFRVMTGSMEPAIETDSFIIVHKVDASQVETGDVISYFSREPSLDGAVNTHRVTAIEQKGELRYFITKGDANTVEDRSPVSERDLIGRVIFVSHTLGIIVHLLSNPLIFIPLIILPLFVMLIFNLVRTISLTRGLMKEEEEAAVREALEEFYRKKDEEGKA
ncbi:MAG: signal peptidase I [Lachnospiraceae bacterium]|nr:signal peptidase I [Lachnospiraceae bacterium]